MTERVHEVVILRDVEGAEQLDQLLSSRGVSTCRVFARAAIPVIHHSRPRVVVLPDGPELFAIQQALTANGLDGTILLIADWDEELASAAVSAGFLANVVPPDIETDRLAAAVFAELDRQPSELPTQNVQVGDPVQPGRSLVRYKPSGQGIPLGIIGKKRKPR